jgi:hypothetical protein
MAEENKFGGLFSGLKKMIFTEEYINADVNHVTTTTPSTSNTPQPSPSPVSIQTNTITANFGNDEMVKKIYELFESINKPGVDFFELWNAAEAMGGSNAVNLQNAFTSFKVLGLTKDAAIASGQNYIAELQQKLNEDIARKQDQRQALMQSIANNNTNLQQQKASLENQIKTLTQQLADTNQQISKIDAEAAPQITAIDSKINAGKNALQVVVSEIKNVIGIVQNNVQ